MGKKYYHSSLNPLKTEVLKCGEFYEKIDNTCPEGLWVGGFFAGFAHSKIPELSFSKSIEASVLAVIRDCEDIEKCEVFVYETEEEPDKDISDCSHDFAFLEEVRYRRDVSIIPTLSVQISPEIVKDIIAAYEICMTDLGNISSDCLDYYKDELRRQVRDVITGKWVKSSLRIQKGQKVIPEFLEK